MKINSQLQTKYHALVAIHNNPVLQVCLHCSKEHFSLQNSSLGQQIINGIPMRNPGNVLFDYRALVQSFSGVMSRSTDKFDASSVGFVVGLCTNKGG
mmetsp:Transcript_30393/g.55109  ORF Transcript_30393/g.55109 Transcript_30393/m.55109 type:complete len:97 (-) Transcript_30393:774-1064(-)